MSSSSIQLEDLTNRKESHDEDRIRNIIIETGKTQTEIAFRNKLANRNTKYKNKHKERIKELLSASTAHGIPNIVKSDYLIIKIMWAIFFIASTCAGSYFTLDSILDYFKFNTITTIQVIGEEQPEFPTVSLCGFPQFNSSVESIISKIKFQNDYKNNLSSVFEEFDDPVFSKCFRFNSRKDNQSLLKTSTTGLSHNLRIQFDLKVPDEFDFAELLINIHNESDPPYSMENGGYWLKTGSINYFQVQRHFTSKLPQPYNDCLKDAKDFKNNKTIIDLISNKNEKYSQINCLRLCSYLMALEESGCGCNSSFEDFEKYCIKHFFRENSQVLNCITTYLKNITNNPKFNEHTCSKFCPLECDSMSLEVSNYMVQLPVFGNVSNQSRKTYDLEIYNTYEQVSKRLVDIYVFYKDLKYKAKTKN